MNPKFQHKQFKIANCLFAPNTQPYSFVVATSWGIKAQDLLVVPIQKQQDYKVVEVQEVFDAEGFESEYDLVFAIQKVNFNSFNKVQAWLKN